jgi:hypothetical protein
MLARPGVSAQQRSVKLLSGLRSLLSRRRAITVTDRKRQMLEAVLFASGDTVPASGIYRVSHAGHGQDHYATLFERKDVSPLQDLWEPRPVRGVSTGG